MVKLKETNEPLEDQKPIPEDATEAERQQIREENEEIRERNQQRKANASEVGEQFGASRYIDGQTGRDTVPPGQQ